MNAPDTIARGSSINIQATGDITEARLLRPSAVTYVTDIEQRAVALDVTGTGEKRKTAPGPQPKPHPRRLVHAVPDRRQRQALDGQLGAGLVTQRLVGATALGFVLVLAGCASPSLQEPTATHLPASPLAGARLWVDPQSTAQQQADIWRQQGNAAAAAALEPIISQPVASWFSGQDDDPYRKAERVTTEAAAQGKLPVLVAYHRPDRDCGSYSAGGSPDPESYLSWVGRLAAGVRDRSALVVLEPDALAHAATSTCATGEDAAAHYAMLGRAVDILKQQPNIRVFIDAGHSDWIDDMSVLAEALQASGIERADGFSLNVSNFQTTADSIAYGQRLSPLLGRQTQFVIDVSRNGRGAPTDAEGIDAWCNPPQVALGENPRIVEEAALAVAFLWIKEPGASDGDCRPGEPPAGVFWPNYAKRLIDQRP